MKGYLMQAACVNLSEPLADLLHEIVAETSGFLHNDTKDQINRLCTLEHMGLVTFDSLVNRKWYGTPLGKEWVRINRGK